MLHNACPKLTVLNISMFKMITFALLSQQWWNEKKKESKNKSKDYKKKNFVPEQITDGIPSISAWIRN